MPRILPMDVVTYAKGDRASLSTKVAPPYDVLDEGPKQQLLARDPHNIVEIDLPVTPPKTVGPDEAYEGAARTYKKWLDEGVLKRHDKPCVVAYEEVYEIAGQTLARRGLFAGCGLEPFNQPKGIYRHEMTIPGGVNDRYKLTEATGAQLSPVFSVFDDPDAAVVGMLSPWFDGKPADLEAHTEHDDVLHRCWIVDDESVLQKLETWFAMRPAFIADGHHRYTTALKFHEDHPELPAAEKGLMVLVAAQDPGMIVKAYHRVITGLQNFTIDALQKVCDQLGGVKLEKTTHGVGGLDDLFDELPKLGFHAMGLFDPESKETYALSYAAPDPLASSHASRPSVWRELDVAVLQHHLVEHVLMPRFGGEDIEVKYTAELPELVSISREAPGRLGVIMQPTPLKSVMDVARADDVMPAKSTFFFPKLASGLVIHPVA
ncbi:MAG: DUF1015 family protein [Phycisphaeraceae bacterium]